MLDILLPYILTILTLVGGIKLIAFIFNKFQKSIDRWFSDGISYSHSDVFNNNTDEKFGEKYYRKLKLLGYKIGDSLLRFGTNIVKSAGNLIKGACRSLYSFGDGVYNGAKEIGQGHIGKGLWTMVKGAGKGAFEAGKGITKAGTNVLGATKGAADTAINAGKVASTIVDEQFKSNLDK